MATACSRREVDPKTRYEQLRNALDRAELVQVQRDAHREYLRFSDRDPVWAWKFRLLEAEATITRGLNQEVLSSLSVALPPKLASTELGAQKLSLEALALANTGRFDDAGQKLASAEEICNALHCGISGEIMRTAGLLELRRDHPDEAEGYFRMSLQIARQRRNAVLEASNLMNIGLVAMGKEHYDESAEWFQQALASSQRIGSALGEVKALGNMGWDYYKLGDFERARGNFAAAAERSHNSGFVKDETIWLNNLGLVYFESGNYPQARQHYKTSLELARGAESVDLVLASLNALAFVAIRTGNLDEARRYSQQALDMARSIRHRPDELYAVLAQGQIAAVTSNENEAEQLFSQVARDPASDTSLRWEAQNSLARLFESEKRNLAAERQYREALATLEHARAAVQHEDFRLPFLSNAAHLYDDYINFLIEQGKTAEALEQADYSRAQTLAEGLQVDQHQKSVIPHSPSAQQLALRTHSTILFYWLGPEHAYLWAITPAQLRLFPLPPTPEIEAKVERYNQALTGPRDPLETRNPDGAELYGMLVQPALSLIPPGSRVIILPDGKLNTLNFETLLVNRPKPHYWIEDVTVETAPALRLLQTSNARGKKSHELLLIGDPITADKSFGELPNAPVEVAEIEKQFSPANRQVYVREQATPEAYLSGHPEQFGFIHFVAHGTASRLTPLESGVVLSKAPDEDASKLYARDIVAHPLRAELVTVSACYGAGTRYYTGEGLVGLSWAFLRAGAHHVIGALWEVSDTSTPALMGEMYSELSKGRSAEDALHTAKLHMLHSDGVFRKPYYWAPFQLYVGR